MRYAVCIVYIYVLRLSIYLSIYIYIYPQKSKDLKKQGPRREDLKRYFAENPEEYLAE